jgi:hypothetical protein
MSVDENIAKSIFNDMKDLFDVTIGGIKDE